LSYVEKDRKFYSYPIHEDDIKNMKKKEEIYKELSLKRTLDNPKDFEDYWISRVGRTLYQMFIDQYSKKMWMIKSNKELDTFNWSAKDTPIASGSKECYKGSIIGYPYGYDGYNLYFNKMIVRSNLILSEKVSSIDLKNKEIRLSNGVVLKGDVIVSTIPLDELCNYSHGELPFAGRDFIVFVLPCKQVFPDDVRFCHYTQGEPYTRIVEYKKLTYYEAADTLLGLEIPSKNNKLYPYMISKYIDIAKEYTESLPENVFSIGRAGTYKYTTIEQTIAQCFSFYNKITGNSMDGMENEFYGLGDTSLMGSRKEV
jgi:UDP-galactopyranose mutase